MHKTEPTNTFQNDYKIYKKSTMKKNEMAEADFLRNVRFCYFHFDLMIFYLGFKSNNHF